MVYKSLHEENCRTLHETITKDIVDIAFDASTRLKDTKLLLNRDSLSTSSLMKLTNNLVLVFPVIISRSIDIETAQMITKAIERKAMTMLQIAFLAINTPDAKNALQYIQQFHQNISFRDNMTFDEYEDTLYKAISMVNTIGGKQETAILYREAYDRLKQDMKNINYVLNESMSDTGLHEYNLDISGITPILEAINDRPGVDNVPTRDSRRHKEFYAKSKTIDDSDDEIKKPDIDLPDSMDLKYYRFETDEDGNVKKRIFNKDVYAADLSAYEKTMNQHNEEKKAKNSSDTLKQKKMMDAINTGIRNDELNFNRHDLSSRREAEKKAQDRQIKLDDRRYALDIANARNNNIAKMLIDTDVKKANEIIPTMMLVNFNQVVQVDGSSDVNIVPSSVVIGVKAKMYPVDSTDIINRVSNKNKDRKFFLNFIRATTREISFVKDFMLGIDKARTDALSFCKTGSSSKIWKILERRSSKGKMKQILGTKNNAMAISTLVISQDEVESLKKNYEFDISNANSARMIMESYNLMGLITADPILETLNIIWDTGNDDYETLSFNTLERDVADNSSKKVVNLLAKVAK